MIDIEYGVFRSDAVPEDQNLTVNDLVEMIEQMRLTLGINKWIPLGHSFGGMLALVYAHKYPDSIDAVIYDCPMWSAGHTAKAIAETVLPYFEQNHLSEKASLCKEILKDDISPKEAFSKSLQIDMNDELQRFCHVIDMERYNAYINEHIEDPHVSDDCWGKFSVFRQKLFDSDDFYENYLPYLSEIAGPQLLIVGEYDMTCGKYEQDWFGRYAPNGRTEILADSAHLSWFEQPRKYTQLITDFALSLKH